MPRIKPIIEEGSSTQDIPDRRLQARGEQFGPAVAGFRLGKELSSFGEKLAGAALVLKDQESRAEVTKVQTSAVLAAGELDTNYSEAAQATALDDPAFTQTQLDLVDERFAQLGEGVVTGKGQAALQKFSASAKASLRKKILTDKAVRAGVHAKNQVTDSFDSLAASIMTDPTNYQGAIDATFAIVKDPDGLFKNVPIKDQDKLILEYNETYTRNYIDSISLKDPNAGKEILESGAFDDQLNEKDRRALGTLTQQRVNNIGVEERRVRAAQKEAQKEVYNATAEKLWGELAEGTLTIQKIDSVPQTELPAMGPISKKSLSDALDARNKDILEINKPREDPTTFFNILEKIQYPSGREGRINSMQEAMKAYEKRRLTWENVKELKKVLDNRLTPVGETTAETITKYINANKPVIEKANRRMASGLDPRGAIQVRKFETAVLQSIENAKKNNIDVYDLLVNTKSPHFLGDDFINQFRLTRQESTDFRIQEQERQDREYEKRRLENEAAFEEANRTGVPPPEPKVDPNHRRPGEPYDVWNARVPRK